MVTDQPSIRNLYVIFITRTNGTKIYINPELIQTVESTPDTVVTLVNNKKMIARDTPEEIAKRFIEYRHQVISSLVSSDSSK